MKNQKVDPHKQVKLTRELRIRLLKAMQSDVLNLDDFPEFVVFRPSTFFDFLKLTSAESDPVDDDQAPMHYE